MPQTVSQYIFGNSLVNFTDFGDVYTNVPIWLNLFAQDAGDAYAVSGGYGFLRNFADWTEPLAQWGFPGVAGAWEPDEIPFSEASFDSILITPANFIQDVSPDTNYAGDTRSPLDAVIAIVQGLVIDHRGTTLLIYEGWADMGPFSADLPISAEALAAYHAYNLGAYHDWFQDLADGVNASTPGADLAVLPVGSILSDLMLGLLASVPAEAFFVDTAPHGTETTYFLAAMITYQVSYGKFASLPASLPTPLHPDVLSQFDAINVRIEVMLEDAGFEIDGVPDPVQLPDGYGLYEAAYFTLDSTATDLDAVDFDGPATAVASNVALDFLYESGPIWQDGPIDHMAARYLRTIDSTEGGIYTLRLTADDAARVYVDGNLILDSADGEHEETLVAEVSIAPGTHEIEVHYLDIDYEASLQVDWDYTRPLAPTQGNTAGAALPAMQPTEMETDIDPLLPGLLAGLSLGAMAPAFGRESEPAHTGWFDQAARDDTPRESEPWTVLADLQAVDAFLFDLAF